MSNNYLKVLPNVEKVLLALLMMILLLKTQNIRIPYLLNFILLGLAITFLLNAFKQPEIRAGENKNFGFIDMFIGSIIPKALWIGTAVTTLGILFYIMNLGNNGFIKLLMIGCATITIASILGLSLSLIKSKEQLPVIIPLFYRALPAIGFACYILYMNQQRLEILLRHT